MFSLPPEDSINGAIFDFIYNLALAYLTSLMFYLIVDYFPKRKKEKTAFLIVIGKIEMIDMQINKLFSFMMFIAGMEGNLETLKPEEYSKLSYISIRNREHYCSTVDYNLYTNSVEIQGNPDIIHEFRSLHDTSREVLNSIDAILSQPVASNLEDSVLEDLELIRGNRILFLLSTSTDAVIQNNMTFTFNYKATDILEIVAALQDLRKNKYPKHRFTTSQASDDEIALAQETWEKFKKEHPEIINFYEKHNLLK